MTIKGAARRNGSKIWCRKNVEQILKNEKYCGRVIMQKTVTLDCISHERSVNEGIKPKYVIENAHDKIVSTEIFDKARFIMIKRRIKYERETETKKKIFTRHPLFRLVFCPFCGSTYRRVSRVYKDRKFAVWRCGRRLEGGKEACHNSYTIEEEMLEHTVLSFLQEYVSKNKASLLSPVTTPCFHPSSSLDEASCEYVLGELAENGVGTLKEITVDKIIRRVTVYGKDDVEVEMRDGAGNICLVYDE